MSLVLWQLEQLLRNDEKEGGGIDEETETDVHG